MGESFCSSFICDFFPNFWSGRAEVFYEKGVLRNFTEFTGKQLCQSVFFNKVAALALACKFIKKDTLAQVFSCEFLRTPFL